MMLVIHEAGLINAQQVERLVKLKGDRNSMKQEIKLNRTDDRPIAFMGEEIISETTKDRDATRWWTIRVFRSDDGYMVGIAHITCWKNERDDYWADEARTKADVGSVMKKHIPQVESPRQAIEQREYLDLTNRVMRLLQASKIKQTSESSQPD